MSKVRARYAPSPTGVPHIGNIRTALFNFLFARNKKGEFILRVEDTDQKRSTKGHIEDIENSLKGLNIHWDDKYIQSERLGIYHKYLEVLKNKNFVYQDEGAWRFKVKLQGQSEEIVWDDIVHRKVVFPINIIEDFVIVKSDGFPTYHFASVVDDHLMQITHVIRGDEWISSTPKHLMLYDAFSWQPPEYCHVPVILGPDKKKLSKREGARSVAEYLSEGYLPQALVNYLALLGWAPSPSVTLREGGKREQELFTLKDLIHEFSLERLNKNSPIFNVDKLSWFNGQWIRKLKEKEFIQKINDFYPKYNPSITQSVARLSQNRILTLADYEKTADFFYERPKKIPDVPVSAATISKLSKEFNNNKIWESESIKSVIDNTAKSENIDRIALITAARNIISGKTVTPPLYESLEKLGKNETNKRLNAYIEKNNKT